MAHRRDRFAPDTHGTHPWSHLVVDDCVSTTSAGRRRGREEARGEKGCDVAGRSCYIVVLTQFCDTRSGRIFPSTRCSLSLPFHSTRFSDSRANQVPSYTSNSRRGVLESRVVPVSPVAPVAALPPLPLGVASKRDVTGIVGELGIPVHAMDVDALVAVDRAAAD